MKAQLIQRIFSQRFNCADLLLVSTLVVCICWADRWLIAIFPIIVAWIGISYWGDHLLARQRRGVLERAKLLPKRSRK